MTAANITIRRTAAPKAQPGAGAVVIAQSKTLIDAFVESLDIKPRSRETYRKGAQRFVSWLEERNITEPTRADVLAYKADLMQQYTACTVSTYMTAVRSFFTYLEAEKKTPNIAAGIKGAKSSRGFRKDALSADQAKDILIHIDRSTIEGLRDFALVNLLLRTGLRTVEAARANIEDIRREAGQPVLYIQGKGRDAKDAFVVLTELTLAPLKAYLKARGKTPEGAPLFASLSDRNQGGRLTTRSISRIAKEAMRAAGIDDDRLTAHSLRHTAVTLSLLGGASLQEAQTLARHANVNTTLVYAHNINRLSRAPERYIDSMLGAL